MADVTWLVRRLKAMSIPEVIWRLSQKSIQKKEKKLFKSNKVVVTSYLFNPMLENLKIDANRMYLNLANTDYSLETSISLLGGFNYQSYKKQWDAGFQSTNRWPEKFSYSLEYKQRDDIGDARTNWELNRHFQFALLAKAYRASGEKKYLSELEDLFEDWNNKNPFLWGISWTSVMEVAIRCSNWCYAYCFLDGLYGTKKILEELQNGILNMADYISKHYSRYSSANNHLIVEAYAVGQVGVLTGYQPWIAFAIKILTREFPLQNYSDGVNKELSLHYQSFYMEAVGLMMRLLVKNNITVPETWNQWLDKMSTYLRDCMGNCGEVVEFGDNDEGKILDLSGKDFNHYQYVLQLMSCLLGKRYLDDIGTIKNIRWLFTQDDIEAINRIEISHTPKNSACYKEGGNTILRSTDQKVLIGIDHAALGFGSIAAHGHADALSFQMYIEGIPIFVDPGTYIYHCDIESRNELRKTKSHNTVCICDKDQSEMLGAFLWGKKAESRLIEFDDHIESKLKAEVISFDGVRHVRDYEFNGNNCLNILDVVESNERCEAEFILGTNCNIVLQENNTIILSTNETKISIMFDSGNNIFVNNHVMYSNSYGTKIETTKISVEFKNKLKTFIRW